MSKQITASSEGINWRHFAELEIDGSDIRVIRQWRCHRWDENQGANNHPETECSYDICHGTDIQRWMADGRPGGMDGLRANYRRPPVVILDYGNNNRETFNLILEQDDE